MKITKILGIEKVAKKEDAEEATKEMRDWFKKRTDRHIQLVQKYCKKIADDGEPKFQDLIERGKVHDQSKFKDPEMEPYVFISWQYKCKDDGKEFEVPEKIKNEMSSATLHHCVSNRHHPEFHSPKETNLINREDRDKPPKEIVDATGMEDLDIAEMVCDWLAMSEEKKTNPKDWADKNVNKRWKFTDKQKDLIYDLINKYWEKQ